MVRVLLGFLERMLKPTPVPVYLLVLRPACRCHLHNNLSLGKKVISRNVVSVCIA